MLAFMSYQMSDRHIAAEVAAFFDSVGIDTFMAHEDVEVSYEWQEVILSKIAEASLFVPILSERYVNSVYCLQESGIAVFRKPALTIIPLAIDRRVSPGFMSQTQSRQITPGALEEDTLYAGLVKHDKEFVFNLIIGRLKDARSFYSAEQAFRRLGPYMKGSDPRLIEQLLDACNNNDQVWFANGIRNPLRWLLGTYGKVISRELAESLDAKLTSVSV